MSNESHSRFLEIVTKENDRQFVRLTQIERIRVTGETVQLMINGAWSKVDNVDNTDAILAEIRSVGNCVS